MAALGLLRKVIEDIVGRQINAGRRFVGSLAVDVVDLLVLVLIALSYGLDVIHAEGKHVLVANGVHDRIGMQLVTEGLLGGAQVEIAAAAGIVGKNRRAREAKQMVVLEVFGDGHVHLAELAAMALVEDDDAMLRIDFVPLVLLDKAGELLDSGHQDAAVRVGQLPCEHCRGFAAVNRALLEAVVLAHGLVV